MRVHHHILNSAIHTNSVTIKQFKICIRTTCLTVESFDNQVSLENFNNTTQKAKLINKSSFCAIGIVDHFQDVPAMSITIERSTESIVVVNVPKSKPTDKATVTNATQNMNRPLLVLTNVGKVS